VRGVRELGCPCWNEGAVCAREDGPIRVAGGGKFRSYPQFKRLQVEGIWTDDNVLDAIIMKLLSRSDLCMVEVATNSSIHLGA
jgi:hypothetical protein